MLSWIHTAAPNNTVTTVTHLYQHSIHFFEHRQRRQRRHVAQSSPHQAPVLHNNGMQHLRCQLHDCCIHPCLLAVTAACCCHDVALCNTAAAANGGDVEQTSQQETRDHEQHLTAAVSVTLLQPTMMHGGVYPHVNQLQHDQ